MEEVCEWVDSKALGKFVMYMLERVRETKRHLPFGSSSGCNEEGTFPTTALSHRNLYRQPLLGMERAIGRERNSTQDIAT